MSTFKIHLESNIAQHGADIILLEAEEAEFAYILNDRPGQFISQDRIMRGLYGPVKETPGSSILKFIARDVRRKLAPIGVTVEGTKHHGYRLVVS